MNITDEQAKQALAPALSDSLDEMLMKLLISVYKLGYFDGYNTGFEVGQIAARGEKAIQEKIDMIDFAAEVCGVKNTKP